MPRKPSDILDTSAKIRAVFDDKSDRSDSESVENETSCDTDSLDEKYEPSGPDQQMFREEMAEDSELYPNIGVLSSASEETDDDGGAVGEASEASGYVSSAEAFGRRRSGGTSPPHASTSMASAPATPHPLAASTPAAHPFASPPVGGTPDAGTDADTEGDPPATFVQRRARRRLYTPQRRAAAGGGGGGGGGDSDDSDGLDDPPPRRSPASRSRSRSRSPISPPTAAAAPAAAPAAARAAAPARARRQGRVPAGLPPRAGDTVRARGPRRRGPRILRAGRRRAGRHGVPPQGNPLPGPVHVDAGWTWDDIAGYVPHRYVFSPSAQPGPTFVLPDGEAHPRSFVFRQFMTDTLVDLLVECTNRYNSYRKAGKVQHPRSLYARFHDVTREEMYVFLGLVILMGVIKKHSIVSYWSTDPFIATTAFNRIMSREMFQGIMGNLTFIDSLRSHTTNQDRPMSEKDPMERVRPVFDYLRAKFRERFHPHQKMVIDESLCLWRGNISMRQYIPSKRHRYGLKTFVLCDCRTGYVQDLLLYTGSKTDLEVAPAEVMVGGAVCCTMLKPYLNQGRILYTDNWYTSPALSAHLHGLNTGSCGTVRRNRKHLPPLPSTRQTDSKIYKQANGIMLLSWVDNKEVNLLSTVHEPVDEPAQRRQRGTGLRLLKPQVVNDYNINMRLVDKKDQVVASAECARKTMRWYKKLFFHLLDVVVYNTNVLFFQLTGVKQKRAEFCIELARELVIQFKPVIVRRPLMLPPQPAGRDIEQPRRLTERHFPSPVPPTPAKAKPFRRCYVCSRTTRRQQRRKESHFQCTECDVGLCVHPCFTEFHTLEHY